MTTEKKFFDTNIHKKSKAQWTPLHVACQYGKIEVIMALLDRGANINARGENQYTPLHVACQYGNLEVIMALLETKVYKHIYKRHI